MSRRRKHGYYEGYAEYRYGTAPRPKTPVRIFEPQQRSHMVARVTEQLRRWTASPFEFEAETRHGMRSALCRLGFGWDVSDLEAAALVAEGLLNLRARRPTWEEGQRGHVEPRENCRRCGKPLDEDANEGKRRFTYCSEVCALADIADVDSGQRSAANIVFRRAYDFVARAKAELVPCAECGIEFHRNKGQTYCGHRCRARALRRVQLATTWVEKPCEFCGGVFGSNEKLKRFCSDRCKTLSQRMRKGWMPAEITWRVFDHFFLVPAANTPQVAAAA